MGKSVNGRASKKAEGGQPVCHVAAGRHVATRTSDVLFSLFSSQSFAFA